MNTNHFDDARISVPVDFGGKNAYDHRPQSRMPNKQSFSDHGFKKPRFLGRYSPYPRIPIWVNRAKLSIPYKSELCLLFQKGRCFYGENCHFAHKLSEIRKPGLKTAAMEDHVSERNAMCRGRECHYFSSGADCPYGDDCNFIHKCNQIVRRDGAVWNGVSDRSGSDWIDCSSLSGGQHNDKSIFHKTKLCARWEENCSCPYGKKCTYAHGREELQEIGHIAELEDGQGSRLMLHSQASNAGSCKRGIKREKNLQMEDEVHFMGWDIAKISEIYADWIGVGHDFQVSLSEVGG